jgi:hypothetical protein
MVSENTIFFYSGRGGHSHDGENSSFIDTSKYSLFDFSWGLLGDPDRQASQDRNYNSFKDFIINTVNQSILNPAGLVLQPGIVNGSAHIISRSLTTELIAANAITANEILAGSITADELSANLVLVNNVIRSNNFDGNIAANGVITSKGTVGWAVSGHGEAVFDTTFIRGSLEASSVSTPGIDIDANGNLTANTFALYANGAIITSSGNFSVSASGNLTANNANITGTIYATAGSVSGDLVSGGTISGVELDIGTNFSVDASGNLFAQNADISGEITSISGSIGGWTLSSNAISAGGGGTQISLNSSAQLNAQFGGVTTDLNFQTDTAYVFRITDGSQLMRISPLLISASVGGSFSYLANDGIVTTGEVSMNTGWVTGIGIAYPGCTTGPGTANYMGLVWDNPDIRGTVDNVVSTVLGTVSDVRSKSYILNAEDTWLNKLYDSLRVVSFNPVDLLDEENLHLYPRRLGLIAQELNEILPDLVVSANPYDEEAFLSVNYLGLVPYLIQAVQDLNNRVKELENEV